MFLPPNPPPSSLDPVTYVVDTNVLLVANGQHPAVTAACVQACQTWLARLMAEGRIALDNDFAIVREYQHKTHASDGSGVGDAFLRWVLHHIDDPARCDIVPIAPDEKLGYAGFPDDARLTAFDASDRKFVAVARAHPESPPILQAADSKWLDWSSQLADHGVQVRFLCTPDLQTFHRHKFGV
ncbi:MAG TPA: hypothetical protein VEQ09_09345 [Aquabacterium sp.]|nr:hypothetical protein [Aquabacterium sp.]